MLADERPRVDDNARNLSELGMELSSDARKPFFAAEVKRKMKRHQAIFGTLVEKISGRRICEIRQDIRAAGVPPRLAKALKAEQGTHALAIRRQYILSPNDMAVVSISIHPADRYSYSTQLRRQGPS